MPYAEAARQLDARKISPITLKINIFHYFGAPFRLYPVDFLADIVTVE
jgi:hypothetical protein